MILQEHFIVTPHFKTSRLQIILTGNFETNGAPRTIILLVELLRFSGGLCAINPMHVNISRPTKNLDLSSRNICKLEH